MSEPKGCLAALFGIFGGKRSEPAAAEDLPFRLRDNFLSPAELSFYRVLASVVRDQRVICCKVRLADLFYVELRNERQKHQNKINQKHVDFVICDPKTMQPLLGIELDDSSHSRPDRQDRDATVDSIFQAAQLPLLHHPAKRSYTPAELLSLLQPHLSIGPSPPPV